jgi:2'-5' RNA ligase
MYIWTGLIFNKNDEDKIRKICKEVNYNYNVNEQAFILPQHISLKTSFNVDNYKDVVDYMKSILKDNLSSIDITITGISKLNNGVIWFEIEENKELRQIHNMFNAKLLEKYKIPLIKFDGNNFQFHSTIFQDVEIDDRLNDMVEILKSKFQFPIVLKNGSYLTASEFLPIAKFYKPMKGYEQQ